MPLKNSRDEWGSVSKTLHWLVVALILVMAWIGLRMGDMPNGPDKIATYATHKSIGIMILVLVLARLAWRLYAGAPDAVPGTPRLQERVASLTHWALYALLVAMPLSGWVLNSASGFPLQWFGLFNLPPIWPEDRDFSERLYLVHGWIGILIAIFVLGHIGAALFHHFVRKDEILTRMLRS